MFWIKNGAWRQKYRQKRIYTKDKRSENILNNSMSVFTIDFF